MTTVQDLIRSEADGNHMAWDISAVLQDGKAFMEAVENMCHMLEYDDFDKVVCVDSAGTVFASAVACRTGKGLVTVKQDHIVGGCTECIVKSHHGSRTFYLSHGAVSKGDRAVVIGDVLTYGKDAAAAVELVTREGGNIVKMCVFLEDSDFDARNKVLKDCPLESMVATADIH